MCSSGSYFWLLFIDTSVLPCLEFHCHNFLQCRSPVSLFLTFYFTLSFSISFFPLSFIFFSLHFPSSTLCCPLCLSLSCVEIASIKKRLFPNEKTRLQAVEPSLLLETLVKIIFLAISIWFQHRRDVQGTLKKEKQLKRNRLQPLHFNILDVPKSLAFKYILV